jgi:mono/diheme cytochrome c family protein
MAPMSRRTQFLAWIVAAFLATAGLAAVLIHEHQPSLSRHALYVIGVPEKGAALFFGDKHCSICHAVNGKGGRVAPDLSGVRPGKPAMAWLTTVLWNHAPGMWRQMRGVSPPNLSQEEMAHILAFLYQAGTTDRPGDPEAGRGVFSAKGCSHCHSVGAAGGHSAPDLAQVAGSRDPVLWMHAMWNHAQFMIDPITREIGAWPQFHANEVNDLIAYVTAGAPPPAASRGNVLRGSAEHGWQVFQQKCIQCHAVRGNGGRAGPELGPDRELPQSPMQFAAVLWNHAPAMLQRARESAMPSPTLQGDEIADIFQFLVSLQYFEPSGSPFLGERLFTERGCARCHGPKASGTREGPGLRAAADAYTTVSLATSLWRHGPAMRAHAEHLGIAWPSLQASDIGDLISFLNDPARKQ